MKKLYHEYFHIPENGKISDKVMLGRTVVAALCVILCLCAFSVSTYAYYYMTVVSSGNNVQAATFEVEVLQVYADDDDGTPVAAADSGSYTYQLDAGKTYTVAMQLSGSVKNAHVVINVEERETAVAAMALDESQEPGGLTVGTYHTETIGINGETKTVQFELQVASNAKVTLQPCWGKAPSDAGGNIAVYDTSLLEEEEEEELEPATNTDLEENPSFNNPAEPDTPIDSNDSADSSAPVVPNTPTTEENGTTDEGNAEGEGESAGGDEDTGSDQSTGEGEDDITTGSEGVTADDAVTDEGDAADENNTVSGDETTGTEVA